MTITNADRIHLLGLGRTLGLSTVLPATPDNMETIQAGSPALREAADMYAVALNSEEQRIITECFTDGYREHNDISLHTMNTMLRLLAEAPNHMPVKRPL